MDKKKFYTQDEAKDILLGKVGTPERDNYESELNFFYLSPFMDAWLGGAADQLQGQIASAKIPLFRMISPQLYWVMTGDDFTLDINNPAEPKSFALGIIPTVRIPPPPFPLKWIV